MAEAFAFRYAQAIYDVGVDDPPFLERAGFELERGRGNICFPVEEEIRNRGFLKSCRAAM